MILRFADYELSRERFELRRAGERVHLEPRVLELLLYLAEHQDRVVTKQELFDTVWKSRFVSESTLTGAIAEARRALGGGDAQRSPIQTVHGRGYRFVSPPQGAVPEPTPDPAPVATPSASRAAPPSRRMAFFAAVLAIAVLALARLIWRSSPLPGEGAGGRGPVRLVLAPFVVDQADEELTLVALSIQDLLFRRLEQIPALAIDTTGSGVPVRQAPPLSALREMGRGAYLVTGRLEPSPAAGRARLSLTLYDLRGSGEPVPVRLTEHDVRFLRSPEDLQSFVLLREAITRQVLDRLLPAMGAPEAPSSPRQVEAYRLYLQALQPLRTAVCVGPTALALLERSLELDSGFAPAWAELGWARYNSVSSCGESGENYALALAAGDRALGIDSLSTRALGLRAAVLVETGDAEAAYEGLLAAERQAGGASADLRFFQSYVLAYAGYLERARAACEEALERDPTFLAAGGWTPNAHLYRREWERFLELLPAGDSPLFRYYRGLAELQRGRTDQARRVLEPAFGASPNDLFARLSAALLAVVEGRPEEARTILGQLVLQRERTDARDGEVTFKVAQLLALAGDRGGAAAQAGLAIEQGFFCPPCFQGDLNLAPILSDAAFARRLADAHERHLAFGRRFGLIP